MKIILTLSLMVGLVAAVVELSIAKQARSPLRQTRSLRAIEKRQDAAIEESVMDITPWYAGGGFYMNVSVGTPGQIVTVAIYTLSSVTYFDAESSSECVPYSGDPYQQLCAGGSFQTNFSSTYKVESANEFNYTIWDQVVATGDVGTDVVQVGNVAVNNMRFGVAKNNKYPTGGIGLGYGLNYLTATVSPYLSFLEQLQAADAINSKLYSLLLNSSGESWIDTGRGTPTGSIVFGGVDPSSFSGPLTAVNFLASTDDWENYIPDSNNRTISGVTEPLLAITHIGLSYANGTKVPLYENGDSTGQANGSLPSVLDVTTEGWGVSSAVYNALWPLIPGLNTTTGEIPCEAANEKMNVTVSLGNSPAINVPFADLVAPIFNAETRIQNTTSQGLPLCWITVYPTTGALSYPYILGSSVMRSMYLVFDLDNAQLSVAQAVTTNCEYGCGEVIEVPAGPNGVARAMQSIYSTVSVATAPSNVGINEELITASGAAQSPAPVAKTTNNAIGTMVGSAAIPSKGVAIPQTILSSGELTAATHATSTGSSPTTTSKSGATRYGAAVSWSRSSPDTVALSGILSISIFIMMLALVI